MPAKLIMRLLNSSLLIVIYLSISSHAAYAVFDFDSNAIVAIKVAGKKDFCSGVVVSSNEVLTATHCVYRLKNQTYFPANIITIGIGENIMDEKFQWFNVQAISSMPAATIENVGDFLGNDIVRLTTVRPLPVTPASISSNTDANTSLFAWGFGEDEWGYYGIKKFRPLEKAVLQDKLISFTSGACRGDSGGPVLNERNEVVGIISLSKVRHCVSSGERFAQRVFYRWSPSIE